MTIRLATLDDADPILEIYAPFCRATPVSFETEPPTVEEMCERIAKTLKSLPWLVCERDQQILGYAYASAHRERAAYRWSVDVSAYVKEGFRRAGIGRALYTSLIALLRLQGFYNAIAGITLPNPDSVGLHEAMRFQPVGVYRAIGFKCGDWHDVAWYQLALREPDGEPAEPLEFARVRDRPEWPSALDVGRSLRTDSGRLL
jgi:phosphinothricin acetyltransferase